MVAMRVSMQSSKGDAGTRVLYLGMMAQDRHGARNESVKKGDVGPSVRGVCYPVRMKGDGGPFVNGGRVCYPVRMKWG